MRFWILFLCVRWNHRLHFFVFKTEKERSVSLDFDYLHIWSINSYLTHSFQEFFCTNTSPRVDTQFHFRNFFINFFHEMNDKVDQFVPQHFFSMKIGNQETNVIAFNLFSPQNDEIFGTSHHESSEFVTKQLFNFICLFDCNWNSNTIDRRFNKNFFFVISGYGHRVEQEFWWLFDLNFRFVMAFNFLRWKIFQTHGSL